MTVNVIAIKETGWEEYLFDSPCYGIWVYAEEDPTNNQENDYRLHFVTYQVFPNEKLEAHLDSIEALAKSEPGTYYENVARHEYLDEVEASYPEHEFDFIDTDEADNSETLVRLEEFDWEAFHLEQAKEDEQFRIGEESFIRDKIEGHLEYLRCNGGYPDYPRLAAIAKPTIFDPESGGFYLTGKPGFNLPEFSEYDFRYIKDQSIQITVERPLSGGLLLTASTDEYPPQYYKQRYFVHTEGEARKAFWNYLQKQGVKPEEK